MELPIYICHLLVCRLQQANVKVQQLEKTAREMGEKLQAVTLAKSVIYYILMVLYYTYT